MTIMPTKISRRRTPGSRQRNGFTLMELLIVISIMLILMLLAIPNFNRMKITGNETSAINSLQAINKAQILYQTTYPSNGFPAAAERSGGGNEGWVHVRDCELQQGDGE